MKVITTINEETYDVELKVDPEREGRFIATLGGRDVALELIEAKTDSLTLAVDNQVGFYEFHKLKGRINEVMHGNRLYSLRLLNPQQDALEKLLEEFGAGLGGTATETKITAPMPGKILGVSVAAGERIELGQVVLVLEAMKMENEISSTVEGVVKELRIKVGDTVNTGDVLLEVEPPR